ncbi:MAG: hypothetical protein SCJ97_10510 [Bacillota bacterium]|nr:hypothetical protein [Bacillota bacterium]
MAEQSTQKYECPICGETFYLQEKGVKKVLCGEENVCNPPDEKYKAPDCEIHYFCSDNCAKTKEDSVPSCEPTSNWSRLMSRIGKVSSDCGVAGAKVHDLSKKTG